MKKLMLIAGLLLSASASTAMAEQQVYSPYPQPTFQNDPQGQMTAQAIMQQQRVTPNTYRVYPGREQYGDHFGPLPRHPGDYKDAIDRGSWSGGGDGSRSFDIR